MKKILCGVLTVAMLLGSAVAVNAEKSFSDLSDAKWAEPYILEMAEMNFISGYPDGSFKPNKEVTHLEGLVLFSRAMGSNSEAMEDVIKYAVEKYGDDVKEYGITFGEKEVCFMLYREALTLDELDKYIAKNVANAPMTRSEAAVVITKAMAAEKKAKAELILDLSYDDAKEIPASDAKYVYYVSEEGIMTGVDNNRFAPKGNVTRAQISVMLSRAVDKMALSFIDTTLQKVDSAEGVLISADGTFEYSSNTIMFAAGEKTEASSMPKNALATLVTVNNEVVFVDAYTSVSNETLKAIYYDSFTANDTLTIRVKTEAATDSEYFTCANNVKITRNGSTTVISAFEKGDHVTLTLVNDIVTAIAANQETTRIENAVIESIDASGDVKITISHADSLYNGASFYLANEVSFVKNGANADISNLLRGDKVSLTIEYGKVRTITATSNKKTVEGTIKEIHISAAPYMIIDVNGEVEKYDIPASIKIKINGAEGSIYDFRLMDIVKISIESQAITSITATSVQSTAKNISFGTVTGVNASYGSIKVSYIEDGVEKEETVMCKKNTSTKIQTAAGKDATISSIKEGTVISVRGNVENGSFIASLIIIEE